MRKRNLEAKIEVDQPEVKARVLAVLQSLSGEKTITEICRETGLKPIQYYKLESQMINGMILAAQSNAAGRRGRSPLLETSSLGERNLRLRQENLRMQAMLRLTRKLFKTGSKGPKNGPRRGRPPKSLATTRPETALTSVLNK
jgi:transposase-like protein